MSRGHGHSGRARHLPEGTEEAGAHDDDLAEVVAAERALLDPQVRRDRARVDALLHPDFVEFGSSGRRWDREGILAMLAAEPPADGPVAEVDRIDAVRLADDAVHLTYTACRADGTLRRRSALWRRVDGRWLLYFHQGTPVPTC
ncbi:MAG TPA: nuclear transport factor 2 family protein [Streptosporangiales bacterium]